MSKRQRRPGDPAIASATVALGQVLEESGKYDEGIKVLEQAVRLRGMAPAQPTTELAASLRELANTHFYAGHLAVADSLDRLALALTRKLNGERHPLVAQDLIHPGALPHEWGHFQEVERYSLQALDITHAVSRAEPFQTPAGLT